MTRTFTLARMSLALLCGAVFAATPATAAAAKRSNEAKIEEAAAVLSGFVNDDEQGIPAELLRQARGIAVIPNLIRGGFILGGRRGRGVLVVRTENGEWSNPAFITLTGGSIGGQIGAESTDVVLVFANDRSVNNIRAGRFTLGGDVTATAGPFGRRTTSAVTARSEVYFYIRSSRGLFAGAAFEGARLDIDEQAGRAFYSADPLTQPLGAQSAATPESVRRLLRTLTDAGELRTVNVPRTRASETPRSDEEAQIFPLE